MHDPYWVFRRPGLRERWATRWHDFRWWLASRIVGEAIDADWRYRE